MNAIFDKEGQFVCVIRNTEIAKARAQEFRGTYEAIEETPGSSPPEFLTKIIPGAVIMRAGGVEWVRRQAEPEGLAIQVGAETPVIDLRDNAGREAGPVFLDRLSRPDDIQPLLEKPKRKQATHIQAIVIENG